MGSPRKHMHLFIVRINFGSYFANSASYEKMALLLTFWKFTDLTDWATGSGLNSNLYIAVTDTDSVSRQACQDRLRNSKYGKLWSVSVTVDHWIQVLFYACQGYLLLLLLLLLPGMVGSSHPPCSDAPTSLSQQSSIHPHLFIIDSSLNFCFYPVA